MEHLPHSVISRGSDLARPHLAVGLDVRVYAGVLLLHTVEVRVRHGGEHRVVHSGLAGYGPHLHVLPGVPDHVLQGQPHAQRGEVRQVPEDVVGLLPGELRLLE